MSSNPKNQPVRPRVCTTHARQSFHFFKSKGPYNLIFWVKFEIFKSPAPSEYPTLRHEILELRSYNRLAKQTKCNFLFFKITPPYSPVPILKQTHSFPRSTSLLKSPLSPLYTPTPSLPLAHNTHTHPPPFPHPIPPYPLHTTHTHTHPPQPCPPFLYSSGYYKGDPLPNDSKRHKSENGGREYGTVKNYGHSTRLVTDPLTRGWELNQDS